MYGFGYAIGAEAIVLGNGTLGCDGYTFNGWKDKKGNLYKPGDKFAIKDNLDSSNEASTYVLTADFTANRQIDFNRKEKIGGKEVDVRYYPIFDNVHYPKGAHFYGNDGTEYTAMNPNITYATVPEGTIINAVRSIYTDYNSVYGEGAGELMIPKHLINGMSVPEIAKKCGVSEDAARYQCEKYKDYDTYFFIND